MTSWSIRSDSRARWAQTGSVDSEAPSRGGRNRGAGGNRGFSGDEPDPGLRDARTRERRRILRAARHRRARRNVRANRPKSCTGSTRSVSPCRSGRESALDRSQSESPWPRRARPKKLPRAAAARRYNPAREPSMNLSRRVILAVAACCCDRWSRGVGTNGPPG